MHKNSKTGITTTAISAAATTAAMALLAASISVQARALDLQQRHQFNIPSERLDAALTAFSAQTRIHVVASGVPAGALSPGVSGDVSTINALSALLRGTGMSFRQVDAETIIVVPSDTAIAKLRADAIPAAGRCGSGRAGTGTSGGWRAFAPRRRS